MIGTHPQPTEEITGRVVRQLAPHAGTVEVCETHSAVVVFAGDRAYKVKKAVDLGFLDFTSLRSRAAACAEELALNRRLAPDVYLGVADLLDDDGDVCDHAVVMAKMPAERRLHRMLDRGADVTAALREVARQIAVLHATPTSGPRLDRVATTEATRARWTDGFTQMRPYVGAMIDAERQARIEWLALRYLDGRDDLFAERIRGGHIGDGHGDLQADDIFLLDDGPRVLDCLDFDPELRWGDALLDVAFLAMDLERLGHPDEAERFLGDYREFAAENWPASLGHHYIAYRAHVRAKVAMLRAAQTGRHEPEIEHLQQLCLDHLDRARIRLVLIGGLPGTGKSTVADELGARVGAVVLRTDEIRRQLIDEGSLDSREHYSASAVGAVYRETMRRAERLLRRGEHVVIDATWSAAGHRDAALALSRSAVADLVELECRAPAEVCDERMGRRAAVGTDPSEATPAVARDMAARFAPWPEATVVPTDGTIDDAVTAAATAAGWA